MINLNNYIIEAWNGVKQQSIKADIENWCEEMEIENYTINSKGEIDVKGGVDLANKDFEKLPYKFGKVTGFFTLMDNKKLTSLKNCPYYVGNYFDIDECPQLDSLEGCPKEVKVSFYCSDCKRKFTPKEVRSLCEVKNDIWC